MPRVAEQNATAATKTALKELVANNEEWLMERILHYATLHDFTRYTSTLKEAWRASIEGLSNSILSMLEVHPEIPEFGPEEDWLNDPCGEFGRLEAEKHRNRGITLAMFLALMKYYRQSYLDLLSQAVEITSDREWAELFIHRIFDRVEISFSQCWSGVDTDSLTNNLQQQNRFLANEKNKFLTLFESYSMPCFLVNDGGDLDCMNLSATRVFGYGLTAGEHYYRAETDERVPAWLVAELATFSAGNKEEDVFEKQYSGKHQRTFVVHFKRMLDVSGKYSGIVVSMSDVTMRIRDKQQLEKAHAELQEAQEQMLQREKMASIGRLATGMAHEINNPLAAILQNLQVVEQRLQPEFKRNLTVAAECGLDMKALQNYLQKQQIDKMHQAVKDSGSRAAAIVKKLSSLNRTSNVNPVAVDVCRLLDNALLQVENDDEFFCKDKIRDVQIVRDYTPKRLEIRCNELEMQQVFLGIICNAVLALCAQPEAPARGRCLTLRTKQENSLLVVVEFEDNGPGMTDAECQQAFDPFYTTRPPGEGLGLGLTMAYKIIQRYAGQIHVESTLGAGCKFILKLPVCSAEADV